MNAHPLAIAEGVSLPANLSTQSITILAKRRVGKSYTMRRIWEQLLKTSQQVVVVDPKGDQWGIRSSADAKKPGFPVLILGGEHGDLPLEKESGELIAHLVVEQQVNVLLDTSHFSKTARAVFMAAFLENLYRLKAQEKYRTPLCVIIDEADEIAPQKPQKDEYRMLGATDDIVRRGGQRGLGSILVTQRSASLNKNVLTQSEMLILLRTIAPQDLEAVKAWIDVHGTAEQKKIIMAELPSLPRGDAYFWSPAWPTESGMFKRAHVLPIETFDSAKTPEVGERRLVPKNLADVDLSSLQEQMSATIEKAKSEDPKLLRKRIGELERQIKDPKNSLPCIAPSNTTKEVRIEVPILKDSQITRLEKIFEKMHKEAARHESVIAPLRKDFQDCSIAIVKAMDAIASFNKTSVGVSRARPAAQTPPPTTRHKGADASTQTALPADGKITKPQQDILDALAWLASAGIESAERPQLAVLVEKSPRSSGFERNLTELKSEDLIFYPTSGFVSLTATGQQIAAAQEYPLTGADVQAKALRVVTEPQANILRVLIEGHPASYTRERLAEAVGKSPASSGFERNLTELKSARFIQYPVAGSVQATDIFFI